MARYNPTKALGEDLIGPEVYPSWPHEMARLIHPVAVKALWWGVPPAQWLGGMLHELFKGKGSTVECDNFRDVTLQVASGKWYGAHLRSHMRDPMSRAAL